MTVNGNMPGAVRKSSYKHAFVYLLPDQLEEGVLYVCVQYATSAHKCFCGCGREVVTPIHPTKWRMTFDGAHVSLFPSVGSWSLPCRSHYVLKNGRVVWASTFSDEKIDAVRRRDFAAQESYFGRQVVPSVSTKQPAPTEPQIETREAPTILRKLTNWWQRK